MPKSRKRTKKTHVKEEPKRMKTQNIVKTKGGKAVIILLAAAFSLVGVIALIVLLIEIMTT